MISPQDLQDLLARRLDEGPVVSVFLDLSVNSDNKRTHDVFLNKQKHAFEHPMLEPHGRREAFEATIEAVQRWVEADYVESNKGAALFFALDGGLVAAFQLPDRVDNRIEIAETPVIRPLAHLLERAGRHLVAVVDREHLRLYDVAFGRVLAEARSEPEPYPAPHDVKAGGYSQSDFQQRKAEEAKAMMKQFASDLKAFAETHPPDGVLVLGTDANVGHFLELLPTALREDVVHTGHAPGDGNGTAIARVVDDWVRRSIEERRVATIDTLVDRVEHDHFAVAGVADTLDQLQKGRIDTLVLADGLDREGVRCTQCNFYLDRDTATCPYCQGETRDGVDLVEAMVRRAAEQAVTIRFVPANSIASYEGVGGLLRF